MAETTTGMTSTTNTGSPLVTMARARRKRKRSDVENAADARKPGDAAEDSGGKNFIKGAIKRPGSLHAALSVPQNQRIPASKLAAAARSASPNLRKKAALAKTLKKGTDILSSPRIGVSYGL